MINHERHDSFPVTFVSALANAGDNTTPTGRAVIFRWQRWGWWGHSDSIALAHPDRVGACFIHDVTDVVWEKSARSKFGGETKVVLLQPMGAALQAFEVGLILRKVWIAFVKRFCNLRIHRLQGEKRGVVRRIWPLESSNRRISVSSSPDHIHSTSRRRTKRRLILSDRISRCGVRKFVRTWKHMILWWDKVTILRMWTLLLPTVPVVVAGVNAEVLCFSGGVSRRRRLHMILFFFDLSYTEIEWWISAVINFLFYLLWDERALWQ